MASLLKIRDDGSMGERWAIGDHPLVAGRIEGADAIVQDGTVSGQHFAILRDVDGYLIEDLRSSNGTWVNGRRVGTAKLRGGDCIVAGRTVFVFRTKEASVEAVEGEAERVTPRGGWSPLELPVPEWPESWLAQLAAA